MIIQEIRKMSLECPRNSIGRWSKMQEEDHHIRLLLQIVGTVERIISLHMYTICVFFFKYLVLLYTCRIYLEFHTFFSSMSPESQWLVQMYSLLKYSPFFGGNLFVPRNAFHPKVLYLDNALVELCRDEVRKNIICPLGTS